MSNSRKPTWWLLALGLIGVVVALLLGRPLFDSVQKKPKPPEEVAKPHLYRAEQECERVVDEHVKDLDAFFAHSKKNTRAFAGKALCWSSKWRLAWDYVPFTRGDRHQKFIRGQFEEYVFKQSQLEEVVKQVVKSYLTHVRSIEGKMLVALRRCGRLPFCLPSRTD